MFHEGSDVSDFGRSRDFSDTANSPLPMGGLSRDFQEAKLDDGYRDDFYSTPNSKNNTLDSINSASNRGSGGGGRKHRDRDHRDRDRGEEQQRSDRKAKKLKRQRRKQEKAALMLQMVWRNKFARAVAKRVRRRNLFALAAESGVLLACEGTKQGETGWYQQNEDSIPVFYEVDATGRWTLRM